MAARSMKYARIENARIVPKPDMSGGSVGPSPFPLLVLVLIIALILLARLRAEDANTPVAMRTALPETVQ